MLKVALFSTSQTDRARIARRLAQSGFDLAHCRSLSALARAADHTAVGVLAVPWLGCDITLADLRALTEERPWYPLVLLTEPDPGNLRLLVRLIVSEVLFLRREEWRLAQAIQGALADGFFSRATEVVEHDGSLQGVLRSALLYALQQNAAQVPVDSEGEQAEAGPARSIRALAQRLNSSEDHLSNAAREHGLPLRSFLDWCIALRALQLRLQAKTPWEAIAWRLGYRSVSGLSEHLNRTLGMRPRQLGHHQMQWAFSEFEKRFLSPPPARVTSGATGNS